MPSTLRSRHASCRPTPFPLFVTSIHPVSPSHTTNYNRHSLNSNAVTSVTTGPSIKNYSSRQIVTSPLPRQVLRQTPRPRSTPLRTTIRLDSGSFTQLDRRYAQRTPEEQGVEARRNTLPWIEFPPALNKEKRLEVTGDIVRLVKALHQRSVSVVYAVP